MHDSHDTKSKTNGFISNILQITPYNYFLGKPEEIAELRDLVETNDFF